MATRQGTPKSGIEGHIRGWHIGARVCCFVGEDGQDRVLVYATGGSAGYKPDVLLAEITRDGAMLKTTE